MCFSNFTSDSQVTHVKPCCRVANTELLLNYQNYATLCCHLLSPNLYLKPFFCSVSMHFQFKFLRLHTWSSICKSTLHTIHNCRLIVIFDTESSAIWNDKAEKLCSVIYAEFNHSRICEPRVWLIWLIWIRSMKFFTVYSHSRNKLTTQSRKFILTTANFLEHRNMELYNMKIWKKN